MLPKKEIKDAIGVDISNFATKSDFIALKSEVHKLNVKRSN